jgi:quinoprotein relay system zinc metallohydrolase 2
LGNAAFQADAVQFVGHHKLSRAMAQRAPYYLQNFSALVGPQFQGSTLVPPTLLVHDTLHINLGQRVLRLEAHTTAHTDNDLTVLDVRSATLFAGDLLFMERLPVVDGSLRGWLSVTAKLRRDYREQAAQLARVVPGHGPASAPWPQALDAQERYLGVLLRDTRAAVQHGESIEQAIQRAAPRERAYWLLFDDNHPRNVTASFTELEWE